jgi:hypothetical protein
MQENSFRLEKSSDGKEWVHVLDGDQSFWTIREAKTRSSDDPKAYYRVLAMHAGEAVLVTVRNGTTV